MITTPVAELPSGEPFVGLEIHHRNRYYYVMRSKDMPPSIDPFGVFSDPPLLVLASLATGAKHGHAMIGDIFDMSGNRLGPGTLYGAISRLEGSGWIEALPMEDRRRPYRLTPAGRAVLEARVCALRRFVDVGEQRLGIA